MCDICGCGDPSDPGYIIRSVGHTHDHEHDHEHGNGHHHHEHPAVEIQVQQDILFKNRIFAERNRGYFEAKGIKAFNLVSSPGSGKTTLLEAIIKRAGKERKIYVVEGDQQGTLDAARISALHIPVLQINTGNSCHLEAETVGAAVRQLEPADNSLVFIENVGNLMCPSLFDLGENCRIVLLSTPEGEDKPLKYPNMFDTSQICIISKTDLAEPAGFNIGKAKENALRINPRIVFFEVSSKTGDGMDALMLWLSGLESQK